MVQASAMNRLRWMVARGGVRVPLRLLRHPDHQSAHSYCKQDGRDDCRKGMTVRGQGEDPDHYEGKYCNAVHGGSPFCFGERSLVGAAGLRCMVPRLRLSAYGIDR